MGNAVVHFEVMAKDRQELVPFYRELFGWQVDTDNPAGYGVVAHSDNHSEGGIGIGGGIFGDLEPGQDGVTFYVEVDDVEATLAAAEALGGRRLAGPMSVGGPTFGHLTDPEGHWIGLFQSDGLGEPARIEPDAPRKGSPVVHFEVIGRDFDTLQKFYGELFGWRYDTDNAMGYGLIAREDNLSSRGVGIGGGMMALPTEMAAGSNGHVTFYVEVPDVEASLARSVALGGQRLMGPEAVPDGPTLGLLADPEGHLVGLTQVPPS